MCSIYAGETIVDWKENGTRNMVQQGRSKLQLELKTHQDLAEYNKEMKLKLLLF